MKWVRRYGLLMSWVASAVWTVVESQKYYGFKQEHLPAEAQMAPGIPWAEVAVAWVVLALEVFVLHVLLLPRTFSRSVDRLDRAATVSAIGCVFLAIAIPTEVRGHYHVPVWFAFLAACVLGIWTATLRFTGGAGTDDVESPKQAG